MNNNNNNNKYNPMTPSEDYLKKYQWSVHTVKRCSMLFKTLVSDGWSCAGAISPNKDMNTNINEYSIAFYWRKSINNNYTDKTTNTTNTNTTNTNTTNTNTTNTNTTNTTNTNNTTNTTNPTSYFDTPCYVNSPMFKFDVFGSIVETNQFCPTSPPAREVEENIIVDNSWRSTPEYFFESDELSLDGHTDTDETFFDSFNNK